MVEISKYSVDQKDEHRDENNQVEDEFQRYELRTLMRNCADFCEEKSAMKTLLIKLSKKSDNTSIKFLTSPKYHCELAGEGVKDLWVLKIWLIIPLFPVGILLGWGERQN